MQRSDEKDQKKMTAAVLTEEGNGLRTSRRSFSNFKSKTSFILERTPNIEQVERMLAESDSASGKIGSRLNLMKMMLMMNGLVPYAPFRSMKRTSLKAVAQVNPDRESDGRIDLAPKLSRR
uniref:CaM_binding domain-containing protein n=1 Tax=Haemonchus contortus TaxID=6289 RepID=A0A7I5EBZ1_HAECO